MRMIPTEAPRTSHRPNRVADLIREEVARFVVNGVKDPRVGFVTITQVKMTADLQIARVYYSAYGSEKEKKETSRGLTESAGKIRTHLAHTMSMRTVPKLEFFVDEGLEHSYKIQSLLGKISREESAPEESARESDDSTK